MPRKKPKAQLRRSAPILTPWWIAGLFAALLVGLFIGYQWGHATAPRKPTAAQPVATPTPQAHEPQRYDVPVDDDPARGPKDAPVLIIEFSDYQCPYCRRFHQQTYGRLLETYGDQIRFVYRDFPLTQIHPEALGAAIAANCAGEQGKYWEYHDKLFEQSQGLGKDAYLAYAQALDLDMETFQTCLDDPAQKEEVLADKAYAAQLGVTGTPTFFINGIPLVGAQPFEVFQQVIEQELKR